MTAEKILAFPLTRLVAIVACFVAIGIVFGIVVASTHADRLPGWSAISAWIVLAILVAIVAAIEKWFAGKTPGECGFAPARGGGQFALGLAIGAALFSIVTAELALAGGYSVVRFQPSWSLLVVALVLLPGAAIEEILFRGVLYRLISEWAGMWIALAVSAVLFGLIHAFNPGATWFSSLAIALEAGVLLAAAYAATGSLWLPIGLHFAWNFFEGPVFGNAVSGGNFGQPLLASHTTGPALLTGGAFGPEASLPAILTCSLAAVAFLIVAIRRTRPASSAR